ncbi:3-phenylpropionate dioxygenase ferredoxin-NAD(+) reductase component [Advenella kashmirensis WT001]|uniref:3-phenylpropionate dioxygenase ferredoxin-NAD(+) reductase component n=1 Tax=Advenella kashmirensis (strain DSM 17095 / LMG 22695 / WT001) TaxID=1036672 RepID=I3U753_ADVKW|nr:FAD-dependent oxidoreductase [Advenella kashmirensis]AFK60841.1 3-phenylpropionate dioxygenase ferredoxin-NAD(+) reductase component [Advenella kashmirensis WT001]
MPELNTNQTILIVGNGQAAAMAVQQLRSLTFTGCIKVVGQEPYPAYERPPLSKAMLADPGADISSICIHAQDFYDTAKIELILGKSVTRIDPEQNLALLEDGQQISYDYCLLATGGQARQLPAYPYGSPCVHYIRTADDALRLRQALRADARVVILGGGFLGMELASTARALGATVDVIEAAPALLTRNAPLLFSHWLQERARHAGITLHLGTKIAASQQCPQDSTLKLTLDNGHLLNADHLIVAIGMNPNSEIAIRSGVKVCPQTLGIEVDNHGRTNISNVFAAGDCTTQVDRQTGERVRMESWQNANEQARIAADAILGNTPKAAAFPWFWTDQLSCNIQMLGASVADLQFLVRGEIDAHAATPEFLLLGLKDNIPHYALAVNAAGQLRAIRNLLEKKLPIDPAAFSNTDIPIKQFVKKATAAAVM